MSDIEERPGVFTLFIVLKLFSHSALHTAIVSLKLISFIMLWYITGLLKAKAHLLCSIVLEHFSLELRSADI